VEVVDQRKPLRVYHPYSRIYTSSFETRPLNRSTIHQVPEEENQQPSLSEVDVTLKKRPYPFKRTESSDKDNTEEVVPR
jgi:hypothetical protein